MLRLCVPRSCPGQINDHHPRYLPHFAIALIGYVTTHKNWLTPADIAGLSRFVFTIAIPVLLFHALATLELPDRFNWQFLLAYYLATLLVYGLAMGAGKRWAVVTQSMLLAIFI